jgi:hypothetical protein
MEVLLIDVGALAVFLGYVAIVYWHGISHEAQPAALKADQPDSVHATHATHHGIEVAALGDRTIPAGAGTMGASYPRRESATARSARSSVEIGQCSSQLLQYASISAPDFSSSASSSGGYPVSTRSRPHLGHSDENGV